MLSLEIISGLEYQIIFIYIYYIYHLISHIVSHISHILIYIHITYNKNKIKKKDRNLNEVKRRQIEGTSSELELTKNRRGKNGINWRHGIPKQLWKKNLNWKWNTWIRSFSFQKCKNKQKQNNKALCRSL